MENRERLSEELATLLDMIQEIEGDNWYLIAQRLIAEKLKRDDIIRTFRLIKSKPKDAA